MKNAYLLIMGITILLLTSCGNTKKASETTAIGETRTEVIDPCKDYSKNTEGMIRATASAISPNHQFAKEKALAAAKNIISQKVNVTVNGLFANYVNEYDVKNEQEFSAKTQAITEQSTNQILTGLNSTCQKDYKLSSGKYEIYIGLELPVENIGKSIFDNISKDDKIKLDYDYEKFKEEMQKELEKQRSK